jgi:hypothetical protein
MYLLEDGCFLSPTGLFYSLVAVDLGPLHCVLACCK